MELVLKAIKSLFRKLENSISANVTALTKKINNAQNTADTAINKANTAQNTADTAINKANTAQETADNAIFPILTVNKASSVGTIDENVMLKNGGIYAVYSTVIATYPNANAKLKVNNVSYPIYAYNYNPALSGGTTYPIVAGRIFRAGMTSLVQYEENNNRFIFVSAVGGISSDFIPKILSYTDNYNEYIVNTGTATVPNYKRSSKLFLSSSTEGSTKRYQIIVDDTGTLSTVEVTA